MLGEISFFCDFWKLTRFDTFFKYFFIFCGYHPVLGTSYCCFLCTSFWNLFVSFFSKKSEGVFWNSHWTVLKAFLGDVCPGQQSFFHNRDIAIGSATSLAAIQPRQTRVQFGASGKPIRWAVSNFNLSLSKKSLFFSEIITRSVSHFCFYLVLLIN